MHIDFGCDNQIIRFISICKVSRFNINTKSDQKGKFFVKEKIVWDFNIEIIKILIVQLIIYLVCSSHIISSETQLQAAKICTLKYNTLPASQEMLT